MEKKKSSRRKIKIVSCTSVENYFIPVAALDSTWTGISFREPDKVTQEHTQDIPGEEIEIRIIDCDIENEEPTPPLLLLFPDLTKEDSQLQLPIAKGEISTRALTKLLLGKKPKMSLLRHRKKPPFKQKLSSVEEVTESDASIDIIPKRIKKGAHSDEASAFADVSSNDGNSSNENLSKPSRRKINLTNDGVKNDSRTNIKEAISETLAEIIRSVFHEIYNYSEHADVSSDVMLDSLLDNEKKDEARVVSTVNSTKTCDEENSPTKILEKSVSDNQTDEFSE